jgi:hypothetical protein
MDDVVYDVLVHNVESGFVNEREGEGGTSPLKKLLFFVGHKLVDFHKVCPSAIGRLFPLYDFDVQVALSFVFVYAPLDFLSVKVV